MLHVAHTIWFHYGLAKHQPPALIKLDGMLLLCFHALHATMALVHWQQYTNKKVHGRRHYQV